MREVRLDEDVEREALAWLADEGDVELADDAAAGAVAAEEEAGLDLVGVVQDVVADGGDYGAGGGAGAGEERVAEAKLPALGDGAADEDRFEEGLGEVDVGTGARGVVVALES